MCDTTIALDGTAYTGSCPASGCDFAFELAPTVTSEAGIACPYDDWNFWPETNFLPTSDYPYTFLAFTSKTPGGVTNRLWAGYTEFAGGTPSWTPVVDDSARKYYGAATYKAGLLEWSMDFYIPYLTYVYDNGDYCSYYPWHSGYTYKSYGGAYYQDETLDFSTYGYDLWSFVATDSTTYVTVDTTDSKTAFDPWMFLMDDSSCTVGAADDAFECTYPPPKYACPSYPLPTTKGSTYEVMVLPYSTHLSSLGDYRISIDSSADPSLTLVKDDVPTRGDWHVTVSGTANIPKGP
jgi:hypothetical protein